MTETTQIFAVGRGQYENVGDIILRRQLLDWLRPVGRLHVYVGQSPDGYDQGLGLRDGDVVYRSFLKWYRAGLSAAAAGKASYVFKPGEIQLTLVGTKEHLSMVPMLLAIRTRGGSVLRVGSGSRNFKPLPRALMRPSIALSDLVLWRDVKTAQYLRRGSASPDLAFGEGASEDDIRLFAATSAGRTALVISLRADEPVPPYPSEAWLAGVREYAARNGLEIWVATQIFVDNERNSRLARDLDAQLLAWPQLNGHHEQERLLRNLYRRSAIVLSDRLHVIIAAFTEGAIPVGVLSDGSDKIDRHFETIGISGIMLPTLSNDSRAVFDGLTGLALRRAELFGQLAIARDRLAVARDLVQQTIQKKALRQQDGRVGSNPKPAVYHLGRAGEVPGGMTQVVNGYLRWPFENVDVRLIVSRGDPGAIAASLSRFVTALVAVLRLPRRDQQLLVAHLSEGGSFLREGTILRVARARGIATIAHLHGSSFADFAARRPKLVGSVLRSSDRVITLSAESSQVSARFVDCNRIELIPNAIEPGNPGPKQNSVVFGGVVSHRKGIDVLQKAWQQIAGKRDGWVLRIAGPVRDPQLVQGELPDAEFLGPLEHDALMDLLDNASIAVLPSREEAMPMFILEAMARECAVVSTNVGGIAAVLAHGAGAVVPVGDVDALAGSLADLIGDEAKRCLVAETGQRVFEKRFSADAVFPRIESVWRDAIATRAQQ